VRFADVSKLIDNLRPLLSDEASLSANDASNAIILTDTQANIKRMAKIIEALDTSISGISTVHVFHLQYGDAKSLADLLTTLFAPAPTTGGGAAAGGSRGGGGFPGFGGFGGFGGGGGGGGRGGGGGGSAATQSQARTAATRVVAVADETSNSVIVSAPDEMMSTISEMVSELDQSITAVSETRIFKLLHADCTEMSSELSTMYGDNSSTSGNNNQQGGRNARGSGGPAAFFGGGGQQNQPAQSERALEEAKMTAVADPRTNSVIVTCSHNTMEDIAMTIGRLDSSDTKRQYVRVYSLQNADPDNIANILHGIFTVNNQLQNTTQQTTDQLLQRTTTGASSDVVNTLSNTSGNGGGGGGRSNAP
jgi:type II secretory pathway component GspD/PulD (secretin)